MAKTWQVVLATIAIFVAGLVTGGASAFGLVRWSQAKRKAHEAAAAPAAAPHAGGPQQFGPQLIRTFANRLDLTDDQKARIAPIVRRTAAQLSRERREVQLSSALAIEKMQDEIEELLTPDQRTKFEELIARQRERLRQFRQGQPAPGARLPAAPPPPAAEPPPPPPPN